MNSNLTANLHLVYVSDIKHSTEFYKMLFNTDPVYQAEHYVAFSVCGDAIFSIRSQADKTKKIQVGDTEIGIMLPSNDDVDKLYQKWENNSNITVLEKPHTLCFGRTFLIKDPDGHIIRVSPLDE